MLGVAKRAEEVNCPGRILVESDLRAFCAWLMSIGINRAVAGADQHTATVWISVGRESRHVADAVRRLAAYLLPMWVNVEVMSLVDL